MLDGMNIVFRVESLKKDLAEARTLARCASVLLGLMADEAKEAREARDKLQREYNKALYSLELYKVSLFGKK